MRARQESRQWLKRGKALDEAGRFEEAVDALLRAAEIGPQLQTVVVTLNDRESLHAVAGRSHHLDRMRRLAGARPTAASAQLSVGAFLLDQGQLEEGRAAIRHGYRLRFRDDPAVLDAFADECFARGPSYLVLGPHKAGTTSLHAMLAEHPLVVAPPRKELHFWANRRGRSLAHYDAYFPPLRDSSPFVTGEASATNLSLPEAATDVAARFPLTRAVVLRRDPVARTYSHYQMLLREGFERRSFEVALAEELDTLGPCPPLRLTDLVDRPEPRGGAGLSRPAAYGGPNPLLLGSCMLPFVRMWSEALGPERVMVLDSAYLSSRRSDALDQLFAYLELPPIALAGFRDLNVSEYAPIAPAIEARLREWFAPHEAALEEFLASHPARIPAR